MDLSDSPVAKQASSEPTSRVETFVQENAEFSVPLAKDESPRYSRNSSIPGSLVKRSPRRIASLRGDSDWKPRSRDDRAIDVKFPYDFS